MTNSKELFNELSRQVRLNDRRDEINSIIYLLLEEKFGLTKIDIMTGKMVADVNWNKLTDIIQRINGNEPIQYIVEKADFYGRSFQVNSSVLIPRPETEQLITAVIKEKIVSPAILDIGTGSGCIAITLSLEIPNSQVFAIDISDAALSVARQNAKDLNATVNFQNQNILSSELDKRFDVIVSNPPYIADEETKSMKPNVLDHEPHLALFVPDDDPLLFYKAIAMRGKTSLTNGGRVFVEINERFGKETVDVFKQHGYRELTILKDINNKDRVISASYFSEV